MNPGFSIFFDFIVYGDGVRSPSGVTSVGGGGTGVSVGGMGVTVG